MGFVHEVLKVVWRSRSRRNSEEASDVVPETCVVGMLLNGHELNDIVTSFLDPVQVVICKLSICAHSSELLCHTNMWLVDSNTLNGLGDRFLMSPFELFRWIPENTIVQESVFVLDLVSGPCGISIHIVSICSFYLYLVFGVMFDPWCAIRICLDTCRKATKLILLASKFSSIPIVEISKKWHGLSLRSPFFEQNISVVLETKTIIFVASSNVDEASLCILKYL